MQKNVDEIDVLQQKKKKKSNFYAYKKDRDVALYQLQLDKKELVLQNEMKESHYHSNGFLFAYLLKRIVVEEQMDIVSPFEEELDIEYLEIPQGNFHEE